MGNPLHRKRIEIGNRGSGRTHAKLTFQHSATQGVPYLCVQQVRRPEAATVLTFYQPLTGPLMALPAGQVTDQYGGIDDEHRDGL
jgi:hypothetical protein